MNYESEMFQFICDYIDNNVDVNSEEYLDCDTIGDFDEKVVSELWGIIDSSKGPKLSGDKAKKKIFGSTENLEALRQAVEYFSFENKFGEKFVNEDYGWMDTVIRLYFLDNLTFDALEEKISFDNDGNLS